MILTVTCNPAIDVTYRIDALAPGSVHRVREVTEVPGGKGVNVARVLQQVGTPAHAVGVGDAAFSGRLMSQGVASTFLAGMTSVRRTLVVHGANGTTSFWEPGSPAAPGSEAGLIDLVARLLSQVSVMTVSGSLPAGFDVSVPATLAGLARDAGVPAVLDLDGPALTAAYQAGGAILTPNQDELAVLAGVVSDDLVPVAKKLAEQNEAPVVLTLGANGLLGVADDQCWWVKPPHPVDGNPTGAGDATVAGIARGLSEGLPWAEVLARAAAMGAAAVMRPIAGEVDLDALAEFTRTFRAESVTTLPNRPD